MRSSRAVVRLLITIALLALVFVYQRFIAPSKDAAPSPTRTPNEQVAPRPAEMSGDRAIQEAFAARRSGVWVEASGEVDRMLADDREGSRHQRFIVRLRDGHSILFAHNIDLASRVPLQPGSQIRFRGRYEWSERGGTIHWTHHDPDGGSTGGWIEFGGRQYR